MLMKRRDGSAGRARLQGIAASLASGVLDRRTFLRRSGLAAGAGAAIGLMPLGSVRKAMEVEPQAGPILVESYRAMSALRALYEIADAMPIIEEEAQR